MRHGDKTARPGTFKGRQTETENQNIDANRLRSEQQAGRDLIEKKAEDVGEGEKKGDDDVSENG